MIKYKFSHQDKLQLQRNNSITIYRATDKKGRDYFCYIICDAAGLKKMHEDYLNKITGPANTYGKIIYSAFMKDPDKQAKQFLQNWLDGHK